jgi:hypothetical protein
MCTFPEHQFCVWFWFPAVCTGTRTLLLDSGIDFILYGCKVLLDKHKYCGLEMFLFYTVQIDAVPLLLY